MLKLTKVLFVLMFITFITLPVNLWSANESTRSLNVDLQQKPGTYINYVPAGKIDLITCKNAYYNIRNLKKTVSPYTIINRMRNLEINTALDISGLEYKSGKCEDLNYYIMKYDLLNDKEGGHIEKKMIEFVNKIKSLSQKCTDYV